LSTLAAAYAETGDFENAKKWSAKSIEVAEDDKTRDELKKELANYEAGKQLANWATAGDETPATPPETSHTFAPPSATPAPARTPRFLGVRVTYVRHPSQNSPRAASVAEGLLKNRPYALRPV